MYDVAIIGCGIVGAAAAYELSRYRLKVLVLERENDVSCGTTRANSAILHAGYDPEPGTLMAKLNVEGVKLAKELCQRLDVPYRQTGSLVLAFHREEMKTLQILLDRGNQNGVPGLQILSQAELLKQEPNISPEAVGALYAPSAAIVSPWEYALALAETAVKNGAELHLNREVTAIEKAHGGGFSIRTTGGAYQAGRILNAAGAYADQIHNLVAKPFFQIMPNRGQYYLLDHSEGRTVNTVVFQCPTKIGKGVLVAPTVHGNLIVGPDNILVDAPGDTATTSEGLRKVAASARKSVPSLRIQQSIRNFAGVRAASDVDDFIIAEAQDAPGFFDLAGIKSPGLTAASAIARYAVELLEQSGLGLEKKPIFDDTRKMTRFASLSPDEKAALVRQNPAYGRVICRCETVTEGEILDAIRSPIPPVSVDGVKRRCNAGMGRCQGGFCGPRIVELISRELDIPATKVLQDRAGSSILTGETKGGRCNV